MRTGGVSLRPRSKRGSPHDPVYPLLGETSILDPLLHHRHILAITGPSYRTPDLTAGLETGTG